MPCVLLHICELARFMNILMDDIRVVREFPLKCAEVGCSSPQLNLSVRFQQFQVQFSNGGHYFAAAHAGYCCSSHFSHFLVSFSFSQIYVYSTYTCEQIPGSPMKGHATSNNTITSLFWSQDDTSIVSTG